MSRLVAVIAWLFIAAFATFGLCGICGVLNPPFLVGTGIFFLGFFCFLLIDPEESA